MGSGVGGMFDRSGTEGGRDPITIGRRYVTSAYLFLELKTRCLFSLQ